MPINKYSAYSLASAYEKSCQDDVEKLSLRLDELKLMRKEEEVRKWLKKHWQINDLVQNFPIGNNTLLTVRRNKNYFNVTINQETHVYSFNYTKKGGKNG